MTVEELSARLERVERENRRLRGWGGLVLIGAAGLAVLGQASPSPRVIEAERLEVKDKSGGVKATLGVARGGGGELELFGADGSAPVVTISVSDDGTSQFRMMASSGKESIALRVSNKTGAELVLLEREKDMGFLATCRGGYPSFTIAGEGGKARMILSSGGEKPTAIEMMDAKGVMRVGIVAAAEGDASLVLLGKDSMFAFPEKK